MAYLSSLNITVVLLENLIKPTCASFSPITSCSTMSLKKFLTNPQLSQLVGLPFASDVLDGSLSQILPELSTMKTRSTTVEAQPPKA